MERKPEEQNPLSELEGRIYQMIVSHIQETGGGLGNREIADFLDLTRGEVSRIRTLIKTKLNLPSGF